MMEVYSSGAQRPLSVVLCGAGCRSAAREAQLLPRGIYSPLSATQQIYKGFDTNSLRQATCQEETEKNRVPRPIHLFFSNHWRMQDLERGRRSLCDSPERESGLGAMKTRPAGGRRLCLFPGALQEPLCLQTGIAGP